MQAELDGALQISVELGEARRQIAALGRAQRSIGELDGAFGARKTRKSHQNSVKQSELGETGWITAELGGVQRITVDLD